MVLLLSMDERSVHGVILNQIFAVQRTRPSAEPHAPAEGTGPSSRPPEPDLLAAVQSQVDGDADLTISWHRGGPVGGGRLGVTSFNVLHTQGGGHSRSRVVIDGSDAAERVLFNLSEQTDGVRRGPVTFLKVPKRTSHRDLSDATLQFDLALGVRRRHAPSIVKRIPALQPCTSSTKATAARSPLPTVRCLHAHVRAPI